MRKELRHTATGEPLPIVQMICKAKLIDQELFLESKYHALQQEVEAMKLLGPNASAKAKANFEIYQKKRFKAIQLIWDFQHNDKREFNEFKGLLNQSQETNMRRSLLLQQNPGYLPFTKMSGSSTNVHEGSHSFKNYKMTSRTRVNWVLNEGLKDLGLQDQVMTPVDRKRVFSNKSSAIRSSINVHDRQPMSPPSRFGGNSPSTRNTTNFGRNATGYSRFRARDSAQLPHNKLPDIAPVIPIEDSVKYRYTNAHFQNLTSSGVSKHEQLISMRQNLAKVTIEGFEKLFANNEKRTKRINTQKKDMEEIMDAKFGRFRQKRIDTKMRNSANLEGWMDKSISDFKQLQIETHNRLQSISQLNQVRSRSHQTSFQTEILKREQKNKQDKKKQELMIRPALKLHAKDQEEHDKRAQSARSAVRSRLEERSQQVNGILQNIHERRTASAMQSLTQSIEVRNIYEKKIKDRESSLKEYKDIIRDRIMTGRERFKEAEERSEDQRSKSHQKTFDKLERIELQVSDRKLKLEEKSIFLKCESESRMGDNQKNNQIKLQQLESIKERVKRKFIKTLQRRQLQQKTFAPPTTFEIYMTNQNIKSRTQANFFLTQPKPATEIKTTGGENNVVQKAQPTQLTPQSFRMPHSDFSFRLALMSSQDSGIKKKAKKFL